jgi:hypothetical protein
MPPLVIPPLLTELIAAGCWPNTPDDERGQNLRSLVSADRVHAFAPEEETIHLDCPPFRTVQERVAHGEKFWTSAMAAPEQRWLAPETHAASAASRRPTNDEATATSRAPRPRAR